MDLPIRLQHSHSQAWHQLCESAQTAAGMSGIFLTRLNPRRAAVSLTVLTFATWSLGRDAAETPGSALLAFAVAGVARHAFSFWSFTPNGIAPMLKERLGSELGFSIYESAMALLLLAQRLSFVRLLLATSNAPAGILGEALLCSGAALAAIGVGVSVWATRIIGVDTYYYRDLFAGPRHVNLELRGPYAILMNPMYGVGQLAAYGAALALVSPMGILAAALNQIALYAFNTRVEQPHLNAATRVSVDSALRDALSRTLLDFRSTVAPAPVFGAARQPALPPRPGTGGPPQRSGPDH
jgi:protein-S-isoprenylcysteine O-methyltransferase Ste14